MTISFVHAQKELNEFTNTNTSELTAITLKSNVTSLDKKQINFSELADKFEKTKKFESFSTPKMIDKEVISSKMFYEQELEKAKNVIKRQEGFITDKSLVSLNLADIKKPAFKTISPEETISVDKNNTNFTSQTDNTRLKLLSLDSYNINLGLNGLNTLSSNPGLDAPNPPDIALAVGPNHIVQVVHHAVQILNKNFGFISQSIPLHDFFGVTKDRFIGDQKAIYDITSKRWFISAFNVGYVNNNKFHKCQPECSIMVAASKSEDPLGEWIISKFSSGDILEDQPIIAVNNDKFILSVNPSIAEKRGSWFYVIDKKSLLNDLPKSVYVTSNFIPLPSIVPVQSFTTSTDCMFLIATYYEGNVVYKAFTTASKIIIYSVCGNPSEGNTIINTLANIPMSRSSLAPEAQQPESNDQEMVMQIDTADLRISSAVYDGKTIWIGFNNACSPDQVSIQSCIHLIQLDPINKQLITEKNFGIKNSDVFYPAIAISKNGEMFFIAAISGPELYPSLIVGDAKFDIAYVTLGSNIHNSGRYGDYFGAAPDPKDNSVWLSGEYINKNMHIPSNKPEEIPAKVFRQFWDTFIVNISKK